MATPPLRSTGPICTTWPTIRNRVKSQVMLALSPPQAIPRINPALLTVQWDWASQSQSAFGRGPAGIFTTSPPSRYRTKYAKTEPAGMESLVPGSCCCQRPGEPDRRRRQVVERDALRPGNGRLLAPVKHPATAASIGTAGCRPPTSPCWAVDTSGSVCVKEA